MTSRDLFEINGDVLVYGAWIEIRFRSTGAVFVRILTVIGVALLK